MIERCTANVWERAWLKERQLLDFDCKPFQGYNEYFSEANVAADTLAHQQEANAAH